MQLLLRRTQAFSSLATQYLLNKSRNAVRFESQNIIWDFEELNYQSNALAKGLSTMSFTASTPYPMQTTPCC